MTNYVCGFYFDHTLQQVVLIWKNKPAWQRGKLNGVGGKIEEGELPITAMRREFHEETGILHDEWVDLITLTGEDWCVYFFYSIGKPNEFEYVESKEAEEVAKIDIDRLDEYPHISNLRWLIPMAMYKHKFPGEVMTMLNPAQGAVTNTMSNIDPNEKQAEEVKAAGQEIAAVESEAQENAMESAEEGTTEG